MSEEEARDLAAAICRYTDSTLTAEVSHTRLTGWRVLLFLKGEVWEIRDAQQIEPSRA